ncbi:MAG: SDR family oxidoreductase [Hyphomicrobiales bacterium]
MPNEQQVLVTGASGFLGSHCVIQLLDRGYRVRGTLRDMGRADAMRAIIESNAKTNAGLDFVQADLMYDAAWDRAVKGCTYVIHTASPVPVKLPKDPDTLLLPARDGTLRVLRAARDGGVRRVVVTSSTAAVSYGEGGRTHAEFTEDDWTDPDGPEVSAYARSKILAERAAWTFIRTEGKDLELAVINPSLILGPVLETDYGSSAELIRRLLTGAFPGCPRLGWPIVDVRDVAALHIAAMEAPEASGHRFLCGNEFMWLRDIARVLRERVPGYRRRIPTRPLPNWLMRLIGLFDEQVRSLSSGLGERRAVSCGKARGMLGWRPRPAEEAIVATAESLIAHGIV